MIKEIKDTLDNTARMLYKDSKTDYKSWTRAIKTNLLNLAHQTFDYYYYAGTDNDYDITTNEWLYDMVWYEAYDNKKIKRIRLVLECEWSTNFKEIEYDFQKILLAKSDLRVMIFQSLDAESITKSLINMIEQFKQATKGDEYLFAAWNEMHNCFYYTEYTYFVE